LVAESRNHFFNTDKAVVWKDRIVLLAACTKRLLSLLLRCDWRGRQEQCNGQRKYRAALSLAKLYQDANRAAATRRTRGLPKTRS